MDRGVAVAVLAASTQADAVLLDVEPLALGPLSMDWAHSSCCGRSSITSGALEVNGSRCSPVTGDSASVASSSAWPTESYAHRVDAENLSGLFSSGSVRIDAWSASRRTQSRIRPSAVSGPQQTTMSIRMSASSTPFTTRRRCRRGRDRGRRRRARLPGIASWPRRPDRRLRRLRSPRRSPRRVGTLPRTRGGTRAPPRSSSATAQSS